MCGGGGGGRVMAMNHLDFAALFHDCNPVVSLLVRDRVCCPHGLLRNGPPDMTRALQCGMTPQPQKITSLACHGPSLRLSTGHPRPGLYPGIALSWSNMIPLRMCPLRHSLSRPDVEAAGIGGVRAVQL